MLTLKSRLFLKKSNLSGEAPSELKRSLSALDLLFLGIGGIIGAGIFVLTGIAAATKAGPALSLSFLFAGIACSFAAMCYAELASSIGGSGSAYNYAYVAFGELIAWIFGWDLLLEYGVAISAVAVGWAGYVNDLLLALHITIPSILLKGPLEGGIINIFAFLIVIFLGAVLSIGVKFSARLNSIIVLIKLATIGIFVFISIPNINPKLWTPFMPFGWEGVMQGAALMFFAFIGFDAVSTAADEAIDPQRDLSIGIIGSLIVSTLIYVLVATMLTGIAPYQSLNVSSPVADALLKLGYRFASALVSVGAIAGITSVILIFLYGMSRIFYAIVRDGLLPKYFDSVNSKTNTPLRILVFLTILIALLAGLLPLSELAELVNIGTLAAFIIVCAGVLILRYIQPGITRPFKVPVFPAVPILGILSCGYLMISLSSLSWLRFILWMLAGLVIYALFGYRNSKLQKLTQS